MVHAGTEMGIAILEYMKLLICDATWQVKNGSNKYYLQVYTFYAMANWGNSNRSVSVIALTT